jgi:hypothetical protein
MSMKNISRTPPLGEKVMAYRNLHKGCWSVKSIRTGRVLAHLDEVFIADALFKVSEAGRQRVLRERSKNVHAGVVGVVSLPPEKEKVGNFVRVRYNPYRFANFFTAEGEAPVYRAPFVHLDTDGHAHMVLHDGVETGDLTWRTGSELQPKTSSV